MSEASLPLSLEAVSSMLEEPEVKATEKDVILYRMYKSIERTIYLNRTGMTDPKDREDMYELALKMAFQQMGESLNRILKQDSELEFIYSTIEWRKIISLRDISAHNPAMLDISLLENYAESDAAALISAIDGIIGKNVANYNIA